MPQLRRQSPPKYGIARTVNDSRIPRRCALCISCGKGSEARLFFAIDTDAPHICGALRGHFSEGGWRSNFAWSGPRTNQPYGCDLTRRTHVPTSSTPACDQPCATSTAAFRRLRADFVLSLEGVVSKTNAQDLTPSCV